MSYLRLIQNKMQNLAETVASVLDVEVAIADNNLIRIVGTGDFYTKIDESCSEDSLFARVIESGEPIVNLTRDEHCHNCSNADNCPEFANMSYPIKEGGKVVGVVSFASFDTEQANIMRLKKEEYFNMLKETSSIVEQEIININITNKLNKDITEVNEIINCLNKGIIILNHKNKIIHINVKSLQILDISLSEQRIIGKDINDFIKDIKLQDTGNSDIVDCWNIKNKKVRVLYNINKIVLGDNEFSLMISFDIMQDIINIAKTYENKKQIFFHDIIGNSKAILRAINKSKIAASTDSTILLQGESGTGKELFARSIHNESHRREGPFIAVNCASIPETLIESELFGYEKGAFTGANPGGRKGKIELANNGTLFLDEIGDLPLYLQTRLLRVLQERTIDRLGGEESININIRVISATNKNLRQLVNEGKFRLDLYYRLNVIPIDLPSLKDRDDDIFLCSEYIIKNLCNKANKELKILSNEVKDLFKRYSWPGNIRELENILEHGVCFSMDQYIKLEDLPEYFIEESQYIENHIIEDKSLEELKLDFEKSVIQNLIKKYGDNVEGKKVVADKLNIGLTTLYRKLNDYEN
ncbi:sigma 54-interacting transcriptional regulator [Wansuia hejianensis]|uniref:Sigma 54-interacting transcriptional regulator n=1 Tax=Wansuia hejianensis TaxID=2763667 RepID=A0A926EU20_9FIRM|nr:sigma 54-interacting transcriptional regulator [Wansuia hejianensis]MBC8589788.1 sigma 54-interacting transcriptional regulator [Wansuia hejianensis]